MKNEAFARWFIFLLILGLFGTIGFEKWNENRGVINLRATAPESGGWQPAVLSIPVGEPLKLRITSDDVLHSFAVGKSGEPAIDILPGEVTELELVFDTPGRYVYYCDRWCGVDHWRMRGVITVTGAAAENKATLLAEPLYVTLGIDIDGEHVAKNLPLEKPSAEHIDPTTTDLSAYLDQDLYRSNSPESMWKRMREDASLSKLSDQQLWDAVDYVWNANTTSTSLKKAADLYARNCAACHGVSGAGDGIFADRSMAGEDHSAMTGSMLQLPANFTDPRKILSLSPAAAQGKLIRGGMGTGMPMWGEIFTDEQIWDLVSYIYTFQFEEVE